MSKKINRQKQYFEQRKRQQQQKAAGLENNADGRHSCSQHHGNERSLDILSFLTFSTVAQEQKPSSLAGRESPEDDAFFLKYKSARHSPAIDTKKATAADDFQTNESRLSSCDHVETICPKKFSVSPPDHKESLAGNSDKFKSAAQCHEISVIDLLGDVGVHGNAEKVSVHAQESHVAFSVEGLGKVESETPIHSPCRYSKSSLEETRRHGSTFKNLNYGMDDFEPQMEGMVDDVDFSLYDDSIAQPFCLRDNIFGNPKSKFSNFRKSLSFNAVSNSLKDVLGDDLIFCDSEDIIQNIWSGGSAFLSDYVDNVGEYELFCKDQVDMVDHGYADFLDNSDHWRRDLHFEGSSLRESSKHITENIDILDLDSPCTKHHVSDYLHDFKCSDGRWYSTIGREHNDEDANNQPAGACFIREHGKQSLSEESCSSSAVRGDEFKRSPRRKEGAKVQGIFGWTQKNKCYEKNIHGKEKHRDNVSNLQQRENRNRLGKFTMMSEASPKPGCFETTFESSSFCQTSGMRQRASSGLCAWSIDVHDATSDPLLIIDSNSPVKRYTKMPSELSPISGKMYFCHPSHGYPHKNAISQNIEFMSTISNTFQESQRNKVLDSLHTLNRLGLDKESLSRDGENNFDVPSAVEGNIELQMDASDGSKGLFSKMGSPSISPNRTPEPKESMKGVNSINLAEDTSSSVEMPSASGGIQLCQGDNRILLPLKTESQELEEVCGPKEMKMGNI